MESNPTHLNRTGQSSSHSTDTSTPANESSSFDISGLTVFLNVFLGTILIWSAWSLNVYRQFLAEGANDSGKLGDSYGIVTSFFSALGVAGIIYTIILQRKELNETRRELISQNRTIKRQRFESMFFAMIDLHYRRLENIVWNGKQGLPVIREYLGRMYTSLKNSRYKEEGVAKVSLLKFKSAFIEHYPLDFGTILSTYLISLFAILDAIDRYSTKPKPHARNVEVLKSYISSEESEFLYLYYHFVINDNPGQSKDAIAKIRSLQLVDEIENLVEMKMECAFDFKKTNP
jgi:hypothetical protein